MSLLRSAKSNGQLSEERVHATADPQGHPSRRACRLLMSNVSAASVAKIPSAAAGSFCSVFEGRLVRHSSRWSVRARTRVSVGKWPTAGGPEIDERGLWRRPSRKGLSGAKEVLLHQQGVSPRHK